MRHHLPTAIAFALCSSALTAQAVQPGEWSRTATVVEIDIPGAPGFLTRMAKGKSKTERKCIAAADAERGIDALIRPEAKANCTVQRQRIADGRLEQQLSCVTKKNQPLRIDRSGTYTAGTLQSRIVMTGRTEKGPMRIVLDERSQRTGATCRR